MTDVADPYGREPHSSVPHSSVQSADPDVPDAPYAEPDVMPVPDPQPDVRTVPDSIPPIPDTDPDPLVHGLGSADVTGGDGQPRHLEASEPTDEPGLDFGLGSENTQDTPPAPHPEEPDPLVHGLGSAEETVVQ